MTPDFSPDMLKRFLRLRVDMMVRISFPSQGRSAEKAARAELRQRCDVSRQEFWDAWQGRLGNGRLRAKIWAALWVDPAEFGLLLTDDGGQEAVDAG
ncbi:hypothetical protein [Rhizobium sp. BK602]|uniref:hypothetical protein n=1 Tax=Rhizobium sp. BK602 TaxID=2586986 RepID=UPI00161FDB55|nr:hypothetical protein [Rhizobium sp. BK602]MBB3608648.1 hypothetical protein [Rhizobium sp. BK602]